MDLKTSNPLLVAHTVFEATAKGFDDSSLPECTVVILVAFPVINALLELTKHNLSLSLFRSKLLLFDVLEHVKASF